MAMDFTRKYIRSSDLDCSFPALFISWYTSHFGSYNKTYGSLGAAVGFMTWIWISTMVILIGAKINAELEHQTSSDTTVGKPEPQGERGARMADTVGRST
jgi:membrane protein